MTPTPTHLLTRDHLFIGGERVRPSGTEKTPVVSPIDGAEIGSAPRSTPADVDLAVEAARHAFDFGPWPRMTPEERGEVLASFARLYRERADEIAGLITEQMGCPITLSKGVQATTPSYILDYYAGLGTTFPWEERRPGPAADALVVHEPIGVVAAIVPWNYPQVATVLKVAPALLAGCAVVLKPAPETPLDAFVLAEIAREAGVPGGVLNVVTGDGVVGEALVTHAGVDKVSFTGSVTAGRRVAELCGRDLRRVTLELGGKSATVVAADADLDALVPWLTQSVFNNTGQTCGAQTRAVVDRSIQDDVVARLVAASEALVVGDPRDEATDVGPLAAERHRVRVEDFLRSAQQDGARLVTGGGRPPGFDRGCFVSPTIFADVDARSRIAQEEIFGPVLSVIPFDDEEEAVRIANSTAYGLSGSVWSADEDRALGIARRMRTGNCMVNGNRGGLDSPFGGFRNSGIGREFGPEGVRAYTELKALGVPSLV